MVEGQRFLEYGANIARRPGPDAYPDLAALEATTTALEAQVDQLEASAREAAAVLGVRPTSPARRDGEAGL